MLINSFGGTGHINLALKALFFHEARQSAAMVQMKAILCRITNIKFHEGEGIKKEEEEEVNIEIVLQTKHCRVCLTPPSSAESNTEKHMLVRRSALPSAQNSNLIFFFFFPPVYVSGERKNLAILWLQ